MKNEEWLTPLVFLTSLLFILLGNAGNTVAASLYYNTADNKTTRQQNNKTTKQQDNKTTYITSSSSCRAYPGRCVILPLGSRH